MKTQSLARRPLWYFLPHYFYHCSFTCLTWLRTLEWFRSTSWKWPGTCIISDVVTEEINNASICSPNISKTWIGNCTTSDILTRLDCNHHSIMRVEFAFSLSVLAVLFPWVFFSVEVAKYLTTSYTKIQDEIKEVIKKTNKRPKGLLCTWWYSRWE